MLTHGTGLSRLTVNTPQKRVHGELRGATILATQAQQPGVNVLQGAQTVLNLYKTIERNKNTALEMRGKKGRFQTDWRDPETT